MNFSAGAVIIAMITGLLGVLLYLNIYDQQHRDYRVADARVQCQQAQFNSDFAKFGGQDNPAADKAAAATCKKQNELVAARDKADAKSQQDRDDLAKSITNAFGTPKPKK